MPVQTSIYFCQIWQSCCWRQQQSEKATPLSSGQTDLAVTQPPQPIDQQNVKFEGFEHFDYVLFLWLNVRLPRLCENAFSSL